MLKLLQLRQEWTAFLVGAGQPRVHAARHGCSNSYLPAFCSIVWKLPPKAMIASDAHCCRAPITLKKQRRGTLIFTMPEDQMHMCSRNGDMCHDCIAWRGI